MSELELPADWLAGWPDWAAQGILVVLIAALTLGIVGILLGWGMKPPKK